MIPRTMHRAGCVKDRSRHFPLRGKQDPSPSRARSPSPATLDTQLEKAVSEALWHPLDPEVIHEPPGSRENGSAKGVDQRCRPFRRSRRRFSHRGAVLCHHGPRFTGLPHTDGGASAPRILQSIKTASSARPEQDEDPNPPFPSFSQSWRQPEPASLSLRTSSPKRCFSSSCNGARNLTQRKYLNSGTDQSNLGRSDDV